MRASGRPRANGPPTPPSLLPRRAGRPVRPHATSRTLDTRGAGRRQGSASSGARGPRILPRLMLRGLLTLVTFIVATTVLGLIAIVGGLLTGRRELVFRLGRLWSRLHLRAMGIAPVYSGLEHAAGTSPRIFLANHLSTLDIWVVAPALPD